MEKICLFIIRWGTYAVLFTPLIISTEFFFPFVVPKTIFFRIIVEIILAAYVYLAITNSKYRPKIAPLTVAVTLFLEVLILASLAGINFERSFWSSYERMTGIFTLLHLYAFFIILVSCFKKREDWQRLLGVSVIVGVLLSIYVLRGGEVSSRGGGTIGNTSFMAAYLLFDIFFALILFLSNLFKKGGWPIFLQIFSGISLLIMLWVLFISSARGAAASFWVGIFLLGSGYFLFSNKKRLKRLAPALILFLIIFSSVFFIYQPDFLKNKVNITLREMTARFTVWQIAFESWKERPWLGWGPENFHVPFVKHFNPCLFLGKCGGEIWFDRAHNIVLDTMVTTGLVGLLSYLAIFGAALFGLLRVLRKTVGQRNIFFPSLGMAALLIAYFLQNLLVFDMISSYLVFFLSLAFIGFITTVTQDAGKEEVKIGKFNPALAGIIIVSLAPILWWGNIQPAMAGYYITRMLGTPVQDLAKAIDYFQKSLNSWMNKYETREHFALKISQIVSYPASDKETLFRALGLAEQEMEKSIKANPLDFRHHLFLSRLYNIFYQMSNNPEKLRLAQKYAEESVKLGPNSQQGYWYLGEAKLLQGKNDEAVGLFKKAIDLEPAYAGSYWYLAKVYKFTGQDQLAQEVEDFIKSLPQ